MKLKHIFFAQCFQIFQLFWSFSNEIDVFFRFCMIFVMLTIKNCALFHHNKHPKSEISDVPAFIKGLKEGNYVLYKRLGQAVMILNSKTG